MTFNLQNENLNQSFQVKESMNCCKSVILEFLGNDLLKSEMIEVYGEDLWLV